MYTFSIYIYNSHLYTMCSPVPVPGICGGACGGLELGPAWTRYPKRTGILNPGKSWFIVVNHVNHGQ